MPSVREIVDLNRSEKLVFFAVACRIDGAKAVEVAELTKMKGGTSRPTLRKLVDAGWLVDDGAHGYHSTISMVEIMAYLFEAI